MKSKEQRQNWSIATNILTAESTRVLQVAPGVGYRLNVTRLIVTITTSAAQAFDIESSGGLVEIFKAPVSLAAGVYNLVDSEGPGISLPENTSLSYVAGAAGVGLSVFAEGDIEHLALNQ